VVCAIARSPIFFELIKAGYGNHSAAAHRHRQVMIRRRPEQNRIGRATTGVRPDKFRFLFAPFALFAAISESESFLVAALPR
jgi:hypothetical protein